MQSEELAKRIFNTIDYSYSGYMDWGEFLRLMVIIRAKTLAEKISLFIKIADVNGDGTLSQDEIKELA
jgi:Ca2+-binding EF-hand superfamily protein